MKIAIFGGSFDPIHKAHIKIIEKLFSECGMDKVIIIPTNVTYYKKNKAMLTYNERLELCKMACNSVSGLRGKNIEVSNIEEEIGKNEGYSHTLLKIKRMYKNDTLYTVIGSDSYNYINTWINYMDIANNSTLLVVTRPGSVINKEAMGLPYLELKMNDDISSTRVREDIRELILNSLN